MSNVYNTPQEAFWAGDFGDKYILRNMDPSLLAGRLNMFSKVLNLTGPLESALEIGPNIGLNLKALEMLVPGIQLTGVEINKEASEILRGNGDFEVINLSVLDYQADKTFSMVFTRGVLIHINPDMLPGIYDKMYEMTDEYILVAEYYNPSPTMIPYRGEQDRLFKRDFAGDLMERFPELKLIGYGFSIKGILCFPRMTSRGSYCERSGAMIKYCTKCIMPSTKPDLEFNEEGVCNACLNFENRKAVDWDRRKRELEELLDKYRSKDGSNYDCLIPVSGGKDSTFQVLKMIEFGMKPLCVTATTCHLSEIGRKNIENIKELGVDYIEYTINPKVRRKLNRIGLMQVGDISWPEHASIFTMPIRVAVQMNIPLLIWGENSQNEYGGPAVAIDNPVLDRRWLEEFGGLLGLRVSDLVGQEGLTASDLIALQYPSDEDLRRVGVTGLFLGHFMPWDGLSNALMASSHGFTSYHKTVEGSMVNYENLDNCQTGIHDYFKYLKFGFGRATDLACIHLRRGRMSREEAVAIVRKHDGKFPWYYLGLH